jgi:Nif-specific regulatory protein
LNKIRSILSVPLLVGDRVIGAIYLDSRINTHLFGDEDRDFVMSISNMLAATIDRSIAFRKIQDDVANFQEEVLTDATGYYLGKSKAMREVYQMVERIAPTDATVLLLGETGTGKTIIANLIHGKSKRKGNRFLKVDCGTLPEQLFESELFGHAKGSFTGAVKDKEGLLEMAAGGTIFLDEITNTTAATQGKLLQAIEDKAIRRVGETEMRPVDIRLICATNRDLLEDVRTGHFREDLFYRLNVVRITVPPLRARSADIPGMANFLLRRYSRTLNKPILGFEEKAMAALTASQWPGNVRELQNFIERASIMCQKRKISLEDLGLTLTPEQAAAAAAVEAKAAAEAAGKFSREEVFKAMADSQGNITEAARRLGTHRRQIQRLLKRYEISKKTIESAPVTGTPGADRTKTEP